MVIVYHIHTYVLMMIDLFDVFWGSPEQELVAMTRSGATSVSEGLLHQYASMSWRFNANQSAGIILPNVGDKFNMFLICLICFFNMF